MSKSDESNEAREAIERLTGRLDLPKYIVEHAQFLDAIKKHLEHPDSLI